VRQRIRLHYGKDAYVIYPPVDTDFFTPQTQIASGCFYLVVSAFAPYKRVDLAIEAFNRLAYPLKIIGTGQDEKILRKMAKPNIEFLGWKDNEELRDYYRNCKALVFPGAEDFGIVPLEAQACGRPVIAFEKGGALESIKEGISGIFFKEQTIDCLVNTIKLFETMEFNPSLIRENTSFFSRNKFKEKIYNFIKENYESAKRIS
jgi:glycosyltransferase involved in cell wall biosynthesis